MLKPEILQTIVRPYDDGTYVEIQISDELPPREAGARPIILALHVETYELPLIVHLQRAVLQKAIKILQDIVEDIRQNLIKSGPQYVTTNPRPAKTSTTIR